MRTLNHNGVQYVLGLDWNNLDRRKALDEELDAIMGPKGASHGVMHSYTNERNNGGEQIGIVPVSGDRQTIGETLKAARMSSKVSAAAALARAHEGQGLYVIRLDANSYWLLGLRNQMIDELTDTICDETLLQEHLSTIENTNAEFNYRYPAVHSTEEQYRQGDTGEIITLAELFDHAGTGKGLNIKRHHGTPVERYATYAALVVLFLVAVGVWRAVNVIRADRMVQKELASEQTTISAVEMEAKRRAIMVKERDQALHNATLKEPAPDFLDRCFTASESYGIFKAGWRIAQIECMPGVEPQIRWMRERTDPGTNESLKEAYPTTAFGTNPQEAILTPAIPANSVTTPLTYEDLPQGSEFFIGPIVSSWQRLMSFYGSLQINYSMPNPVSLTFEDPQRIADGALEGDTRSPVDADLLYTSGTFNATGPDRYVARKLLPIHPTVFLDSIVISFDELGNATFNIQGTYYAR